MLYILTHHRDRSVDLVLLSQRNMLVRTTTMLLFFVALLTEFVARLPYMVRSLSRRQGVTFGQLSGILNLSLFQRLGLHTTLATKRHKSFIHSIAHSLSKATPQRPTFAADLRISSLTSLPSGSSFILTCASLPPFSLIIEPIEKSKESEEATNEDTNALGHRGRGGPVALGRLRLVCGDHRGPDQRPRRGTLRYSF